MALHPYDLYDVRSLLSEEERAVQDTVARFTDERVLPIIGTCFDEGRFPTELIPEIAELGLLGATLPAEYGGSELNYVSYGLICQELERGDSGLRSFVSVQSSLCMYPIYAYGSEEQRMRWLPDMARGKVIGCFGLTEAHGGSDPASMKTRAVKDGGDWVINGSKMWITNGPDADVLVVYARNDFEAGPRGITAFLIEKGFKGFSVAQKLDKLGMRGSHTGELVFQDCEVPVENVLGGLGRGVNVLMSGLDFERAVLSGGPLGIMSACMDVVVPYVHERKQFGQPIGEFQLMQGKLADMYSTMMATRAYVYEVGRQCDRSHAGKVDVRSLRKDAAGAILFSAEKATWMAGEAIQCLGGNGYINDYPTGRLWRDAKLYEIGAGTSEIRRMLIGRELFGETQ